MSFTISQISNVIGIIGVILVLLAYYLLQSGCWHSGKVSFSLTNLIGSILILFSLFFHWNLASVVIEFAWIAISTSGVVRALRAKKDC